MQEPFATGQSLQVLEVRQSSSALIRLILPAIEALSSLYHYSNTRMH